MTLAASYGAAPSLVEIDGISTPAVFTTVEQEVRAIRTSVGLSARLDVSCLRLGGPDAWDVLGRVCPANLFLRDAQLRHTLLLDPSAQPVADLYVGNDDEAFLVLAEGLPTAALMEHFTTHAPDGATFELTDLGETHCLIALDGPFAWEVLAALAGPDVAGFPFHTFYHPSEQATYVRAGKTGEYGYGLLVPRGDAPSLWRRLREVGRECQLCEVGLHALWHASLENWFFNIHREGRTPDITPVELQLQWRLSSDQRDWVGRAALQARPPTHRTVALVGAAPLEAGAEISCHGRSIGRVLVAEHSLTLGIPIGIGLVERTYAHSGIDCFRGGDVPVHTVSPPFVNNLSLYVDPQRHSWATRGEIAYAGPRPPSMTVL